MYVAILKKNVIDQKRLIDDIIYEIVDSRVNYIFRTYNPYQRLISYLDKNTKTKDAVLKHRFYVEYKIKEVISDDR